MYIIIYYAYIMWEDIGYYVYAIEYNVEYIIKQKNIKFNRLNLII